MSTAPFRFTAAAFGAIDRQRGQIAYGSRGLRERTHAHEHAFDVRMCANWRGFSSRHSWRAPLSALAGIGDGQLNGPFGNAHSLQTDSEPRTVHHGEHAGHAGILFADNETGRAVTIAEDHGAGRRTMNAEFALDRMRAYVVTGAERAFGIHQEFRPQKQRNPP